MQNLWCFIRFLLPVLLVVQISADKPYSVELNSFEPNKDFDSDGKWIDWGTLRMKKVGRNKFTLAGDIEVKRNLGNEERLSLQVFVYDSDAKKRGPMVMNVRKPFCDFINEDEDTYPFLQKKSNLPEKGDCPFPKGKYTIDNYELETNFLPDDAPKGDYLLELALMDTANFVSGINAVVTLT